MGYEKGDRLEKNEKETLEDILNLPVLSIEERGISLKTAKHFGVRTALDPSDGETPIAYYFPNTKKGEVVGFMKRDLKKAKSDKYHFTTIGEYGVSCELFGTNCGNSTGGKKVWITEGQFDAMICWQTLKKRWPKANPTVLSINNGTRSAVKNIGNKENMRYLKKFSEIIIAFDNDEATQEEKKKGVKKGKEALEDVYGLIPDIKVVSLPEDLDCCDTVEDVGEEEFYWLLMKPINFAPEGFVKFDDIRDRALEMPELGDPWPWPSLTKYTLGIRTGEGHYFVSGVKMGKSETLNKIVQYSIENREEPVAVFKFEESPDETLKKIAGKFFKRDFVNPERVVFISEDGTEVDVWGDRIVNRDIYFSKDELERAIDAVGDRVILYNNYGRCHWSQLKGAIRHAVLVEGVKRVFIDPITRLTVGLSASEANTELETFADEISKMSVELGFTYFCFCHANAPKVGPPHEMGGKLYSNQATGSRSMMRACYYFYGLEGNKSDENPEKVRNTRELVILEDRKYGRTGRVKLFYDKETGDFVEMPQEFWDNDNITSISQWDSGDYETIQSEEEEKF